MNKPRIKEILIVEGRYDRNTLSQVVDATIIETSGFGIFKNAEKREMIRKLAEKNGIIILTDSDASGFMIRNYIKGFVAEKCITNAYIPRVHGKERRKAHPGKEGILGVEGMTPDVLLDALRKAGATFADGEKKNAVPSGRTIAPADLYRAGLSGGNGSREKREKLLSSLGMPQTLSAKALLEVLNRLYTYDEFMVMWKEE